MLFTHEPGLRSSLKLTLLAQVLMVYCAAVGVYAVSIINEPSSMVWAWAVGSVAGQFLIYVAVRGGATRGLRDPALTIVQILFGITSGAVAYSLVGPFRAAVFPVLMLAMIFALFSLSTRAVAATALYAVLLMGAVMWAKAHHDPVVYLPAIEVGHFMMVAVMVPVVPVLALRLAEARARQERQRHDLLRVQALASRDELTGLVNRREMITLLQRAQAVHESGRPYCVAVIDLDHFKRVNDLYGHGTGDEVLRRFADIGRSVMRDHDTLARWGGEEFVVLLGDSQLAAARAGIERLREHLASHAMVIGPHSFTVTMSAGIAEPTVGESFERALSRADHALYAAKARGRNAVVPA